MSQEHHKLCNIPRNSFAFEELLKFIHAAFESLNPSLWSGNKGESYLNIVVLFSQMMLDNLPPSLQRSTTTQSSKSNSTIESPSGKLMNRHII